MPSNQYPLDLDALTKGQSFTNEQVTEIIGVDAEKDPTRFRFTLMSLQQLIQHHTGFTVKIGDNGLTILTDAEAAEHNRARFSQHMRGLHNRYELALNVDREALTEDQRARHDGALLRNGRILQALNGVVQSVTLDGSSRTALPQSTDGNKQYHLRSA